jgi:glutamate-1-semialdehyde 2,1-aminomutase
LRELCDRHGALLLFDEVMTGFRVAWGGAQVLYDVRPDLTCLGKVIGGGLPCAAYGGPRNLMEQVSPAGAVYQAGTLSGNPLAMAGGLATLEILSEPETYEKLERKAATLEQGLLDAAAGAGVPLAVNRVGSMLTPFFVRRQGQAVTNFADATACDTAAYATFFHAMLDQGVHLAPSQYEAMFVGTAHKNDLIEETVRAASKAMKSVSKAKTETKT